MVAVGESISNNFLLYSYLKYNTSSVILKTVSPLPKRFFVHYLASSSHIWHSHPSTTWAQANGRQKNLGNFCWYTEAK